jgi:hypothetical protein
VVGSVAIADSFGSRAARSTRQLALPAFSGQWFGDGYPRGVIAASTRERPRRSFSGRCVSLKNSGPRPRHRRPARRPRSMGTATPIRTSGRCRAIRDLCWNVVIGNDNWISMAMAQASGPSITRPERDGSQKRTPRVFSSRIHEPFDPYVRCRC